jgi:hypothetical protein
MSRTSNLSMAAAAILLVVLSANAQRPEPARPRAPMLTNEDVLSPAEANSQPEESLRRTNAGSPLRNPRPMLESVLNKMAEVNSMRTRLQTFTAEGQKEILIERTKPDRMHVITTYGEMIAIGRKFYAKKSGVWEVTPTPAGAVQSDPGFDFLTLVKQTIGKSSVRVTGQLLGSQMVDGTDTVAYEFGIVDGAETGTLQVGVGKADGFLRRLYLKAGPLDIRVWFTNINERLSIEPPL